ncbi:hypothetical protein J7E38_06700 [Bacillus sp. ISL-35]|uniref:hypothetical protein n=1 Tax=Bacillus sp. ISL-35 TaxID=2819122 RepID=UPI001BE5A36B|nr:hypothetical protein [Bacillus sp. ISL-35]MBT2678687.1 hypothetical protein [Bacillus sp. ISL-35]MBT2703679.1 hypothetical protein [Chryseobacterium sp. ISL-80]
MKRNKLWGAMLLTALLIGIGLWWTITEMKDRRDPLNQADAFVYTDNGMLYWFELTSRKGKVEGSLHQQKLMDGYSESPYIEEKTFPLTGESTEKGYEFIVNADGKRIAYHAFFSGPHLSVQKLQEKDSHLYNPVSEEELAEYVDALLNYHAEEKENERLRKFFSDLRQVFGYLHTSEDGSYQLFIKIDEALLEGELTGSLFMVEATDDKNQPYEESKYVLNGVTDGQMVELYTTVDNKKIKMTGDFHDDAQSFDLSFWKANKQLTFNAINKEEYQKIPFFR